MSMLEFYFGLVPGEEPVDRLVDGTIPDPSLVPHDDPNSVIADPAMDAMPAPITRDQTAASGQ
jgi:hypothetical protein